MFVLGNVNNLTVFEFCFTKYRFESNAIEVSRKNQIVNTNLLFVCVSQNKKARPFMSHAYVHKYIRLFNGLSLSILGTTPSLCDRVLEEQK